LDDEKEVIPTCKELGIGYVGYSPLGRGFLSGQITKKENFAPDDFRKTNPRFVGENFEHNLEIVHELTRLSKVKGCTPSQLALAWILHQEHNVIPIPGTKRATYLLENMKALEIKLTTTELKDLALLKFRTRGTRYTDVGMKMLHK